MKKHIFLLLACMSLSSDAFASRVLIDSLRTAIQDSLKMTTTDCGYVNIELAKRIATSDKLESQRIGEEALECALATGIDKDIYVLHSELAEFYFSNWGMADRGIELYQQAIDYTSDPQDSNWVLNRLGIMHGEKGQLDKALQFFFKTTEISKRHNLVEDLIVAKSNIGKAYGFAGDVEKSLFYYNQILEIETGDIGSLTRANYMSIIADLYYKQDKLGQAEKLSLDVLDLLEKEDNRYDKKTLGIIANVYFLLSDINLKQNQSSKALYFANKVDALSIDVNDMEYIQISKLKLMDIHFHSNDFENAIEIGEELVSIIDHSGTKLRRSTVHQKLSFANKANGNYEKALFHYQVFDSLSNLISSEAALENLFIAEQKSIEQTNENLRISEKYYKNLSERRFYVNGILSVLGLILFGLLLKLFQSQRINNKLTDELQSKNNELNNYINSNMKLEQFAHIASHDMKSPLRAISSYTSLLKTRNETALDEKSKKYLSFIEGGTMRLMNLVNDLLSYSKVNSQVLNISEFNFDELISEIEEDLDFEINKHSGVINLNSKNQLVRGDRQKLKQVFMNLVNNSLKFTDPEKQAVIDIDITRINENVSISIADNGIGICQKFQERMFQPYQRFHRQDEYEGTGLGLSMVSQIIKKHDGEIICNSVEGQGTTFTITIPYNQAA